MLRIAIPKQEQYDEVTDLFIYTEERTLELEHSLYSLSLWESKWKVPFFDDAKKVGSKSGEQILDYIKCMTINRDGIPDDTYLFITPEILKQIMTYIEDPMTATTFKERNATSKNHVAHNAQFITSELIYSFMFSLNIPLECERWNLNRLMVLIRCCQENNKSPEKMSKREVADYHRALNSARRRKR